MLLRRTLVKPHPNNKKGPHMKCSNTHLGLCLSALLCGCSTPYSPPQFDGKGTFPGLEPLAAQAAAAPGNSTLDVLIVHGMCSNDYSTINAQLNYMRAIFGLPKLSNVNRLEPIPDSKIQFAQDRIPLSKGALRVTALLWTPLTTEMKKGVCYDETTKTATADMCTGSPDNGLVRASINADIKSSILDDCLSDVVAYLGNREQMIEEMQRAIIFITANSEVSAARFMATPKGLTAKALENHAPLALISESLGSKYVTDALDAMQHHANPSLARNSDLLPDDLAKLGDQIAERTSVIYMAANQLPLLAMADKPATYAVGVRSKEFRFRRNSFEAITSHPLASQSPVVERAIVAFTDPSDLLSYTLIPWGGARDDKNITDAKVSNDSIVHLLYLGVENPWTAHTTYLANPDVQPLIRCGRPSACASGH